MKKLVSTFLAVIFSLTMFTGCGSSEQDSEKVVAEPDIEQVKSICNLATVECYYHNVAKSTKIAESGLTHIGEKDRDFWIQYTGIAKLGIDMSKVKMEIKGNKITVTLPKAKVMGLTIDKDSLNKEDYITSEDGFNSNEITADDQTAAIDAAQNEMKVTVQSNSTLLENARDRAKRLIENYIQQLENASGKEYKINWDYLDES